MTLIQQFIAYLGEHLGDAYVWGARGQCLDNLNIAKFVKNSETSAENYERAMRFIAKSTKKPLYAFDCSGLICGFLMAKGLSGRVNSRTMYAKSKRIHRDELQPGDLVFFNGRAVGKRVGHVGIVTDVKDNGTFEFIHSSNSRGVVVSSSEEPYYKRRYVGANRVIKSPANKK